ncbi:MAG: integration host factor subunit beta [Acidobacteria bacterium]|nr:MAG: integration host factor subunit beta [Acidobacteriota bacterium]
MVKADIVNRVVEQANIGKAQAVKAVEALFDALREAMARGERIEFRGFGVFQVRPRKRGFGRNPRTGREVRIPPGRTVRFKPGKDLRDIEP